MTTAELALFTTADHGGPASTLVVGWGAGVESTAYLVEVLTDPQRHHIDPTTMVVLHAVVGSEWPDTYTDAEQHLLPLLADRGVRTVQLARAGPYDADGIVVLDDTTRPTRLHRRGPWTLADESAVSGTVPQLSHRHCSLKFKGWPLDYWITHNLGGRPFEHVIGYNVAEQKRAKRDLVYETATRKPTHPLVRWGWTRDACRARLLAEFGIIWKKSACVFCPYAGGKSLESTLRRMREHPDEAATALLLEAPAIALNPNSRLYGQHSLLDRLVEDGNSLAVDLFHARLQQQPWSVYDVRRLYFAAKLDKTRRRSPVDPTRKGTSWRSVRPVFTGTMRQAQAELAAIGPVDAEGRVWLRHPDADALYPRAEQFLVATTAGIAPKQRESFPEQWHRLTGETLPLSA